MVVYALYDVYFNGEDQWENIIDLYATSEDAMQAMEKLELAIKDPECQSYYVRELPVL